MSMSVTMLTYDPGSSIGKTVFLLKIPDTTSKEANTKSIQIYEAIRDTSRVSHMADEEGLHNTLL